MGPAPIHARHVECNDAIAQDPRLARDPRDRAVTIVDREVVSETRGHRPQDSSARARERHRNLKFAELAPRRSVFWQMAYSSDNLSVCACPGSAISSILLLG